MSGCKANDVDVVYTMWSNLKKMPDMDVGQVGFHKHKEVGHDIFLHSPLRYLYLATSEM